MVFAGVHQVAPARERAQGQGDRRLPSGPIQGALQDSGEPHLQPEQSSEAAGPLAQGPLHRGREAARKAPRRSWLVRSVLTIFFSMLNRSE